MIDYVQFQTTLTLPVIRISLAFQLILSSTHHHKPRICTGNDPVKIIGLDVGLKLDLFFGSAFDLSIYCIGNFTHLCPVPLKLKKFRTLLVNRIPDFQIVLITDPDLFHLFLKLFFRT